jgi:small redox-active disulfide protein 2
MKEIIVLGPGCANCKATSAFIESIAAQRGVEIRLTKVEDMQAILSHGIMSTPGVVVDGKVVHAGGVPSREKIEGWLT